MKIDKELQNLIRKQDKKAQLLLYKDCFQILMNVAYRYKKNKEEAASLVNEAFLKILENFDKYALEKPFIPWIKRICINTAIDDFRKNSSYFQVMDLQDTSVYENQIQETSSFENSLDLEKMHALLQQLLPNASRIVFLLYAVDAYSHEEIAKELNISTETSKWHVKTARKILQEHKEKFLH